LIFGFYSRAQVRRVQFVNVNVTDSTIQTYYSEDLNPLVAQGAAVPNDMSGGGEYQFGLLKKPTDNAPGANINTSGFQEPGIDEGIILGGIFMEDSSAGMVTLS